MKPPVASEPAYALSNMRGAPEAPEAHSPPQGVHGCQKLRLARLREVHDHLTERPKNGHRYVTAAGKRLYDSRYAWPLESGDASPPPQQIPCKSGAPGVKQRKHAVDAPTETKEDAFHNKPMISIPIPDHIQALLVDDWENITKNNQLVPLPHAKPVTTILDDYLGYERPHREEGTANMDILEEVIAGFREYFEKALSRILLYRFERHQYMDMRKLWDNAGQTSDIKSVCDVYGAEHLARLIVSLPELLAQTNMDQQSVSRLREEIGKFTVWLGRNCESYFVNEYETPSQEYVDKARSF